MDAWRCTMSRTPGRRHRRSSGRQRLAFPLLIALVVSVAAGFSIARAQTGTGVAVDSSVELSPAATTATAGTEATLTARLRAGAELLAGANVHFAVTGANNVARDATTDANGEVTLAYTGTATGTDTVTACLDANGNHQCDAGEVTATTHVTFVAATGAGGSRALTLSPGSATNPVGTEHTVTARVTESGTAVFAAHVHFEVAGANANGGDALTNADGTATFTYRGAASGTD